LKYSIDQRAETRFLLYSLFFLLYSFFFILSSLLFKRKLQKTAVSGGFLIFNFL